MMNLDTVIKNLMDQDCTLGHRMRKAVAYSDAVKAGEISEGEYQDLMEDLRRLEDIELSAAELDQKIAFDHCMKALISLPI